MGYIFTDPENAADLAGYALRRALAEGNMDEARLILNDVERWKNSPREVEAYRIFISKYGVDYRKAVELLEKTRV